MKIFPKLRSADAKEMRHQGERAFTMVEIAIAIGVIGFALVAIIGILPTGMNVQKDNREDTVISQDAPYFLDAIRNGVPVNGGTYPYAASGLDFLTNYVQSIQFGYVTVNNGVATTNYPFPAYSNFGPVGGGAVIIGLLSTPQTNYGSPYFSNDFFIVTATVRALSGPATAQQTTNLTASGMIPSMAFTYNMEVFISPFNNFAPDSTNFLAYANDTDPNPCIIRSNRWLEANPYAQPLFPGAGPYISPGVGALTYNLFDVRLRFSWPVLPNGNVGPGRQTYRTLVAAPLLPVLGATNFWFFQPQFFVNSLPANL